jgi:hypothetical protein
MPDGGRLIAARERCSGVGDRLEAASVVAEAETAGTGLRLHNLHEKRLQCHSLYVTSRTPPHNRFAAERLEDRDRRKIACRAAEAGGCILFRFSG